MKRTVEIRQLNVAMHEPHSPGGYVDLLTRAYHLKHIFKRGRSDGYQLGALYGARDALKNNELSGEIYRFTRIDPGASWFNADKKEPAQEDEMKLVAAIPSHLHPNLDRINFIFRPESHRFWYISKDRHINMGPGVAQRFLQDLFDMTCRKHNLPKVNVTVTPDKKAVEEVFSIHRITRLTMVFNRPNDDGSEMEKRIKDKMRRNNANRAVEAYTSSENEGLTPDEDLRKTATASANNGHVIARGYDASGLPREESTKARPAKYPAIVESQLTSTYDVLRQTIVEEE